MLMEEFGDQPENDDVSMVSMDEEEYLEVDLVLDEDDN